MSGKAKNEVTRDAFWIRVEDLGKEMKNVGRQLWLASLGAVDSVDRTSRGLVSDLVARGRRVEDRELPALEDRFRKVGDRITALRDRLEHDVEERLSNTLQRFGVSKRDDVHELIERIENLTRKVKRLAAKA